MNNVFYLCKEKLTGHFSLKTPQELQVFNPPNEYHTSICCYSDDMVEHMTKHKSSPAGYNGTTLGENYIIDVDQPKLMKEGKLLASRVAKWLTDKQIEFYSFTSGNKGYHFYIPASQVEVPEEFKTNFNVCGRAFRDLIAKEIKADSPVFMTAKYKDEEGKELDNAAKLDDQIYGSISTIRFPFSKHPKSGLRKVNVAYMGHSEYPFEEDKSFNLLNDSTVKCKLFGRPDTPTVKLKLAIEHKVRTPQVGSENTRTAIIPYGEPMCIYNMKNERNQTGQRRKVAMILISYYRSKALSYAETKGLLNAWSQTLSQPLDHRELEDIMRTYEKGYKYSCDDPIKKQYCIHTCIFFQAKETDESTAWEGGSHAENFYKFKQNIRSIEGQNEIDLSMLYPDFDKLKLNAIMGQILVLCAASGVGKTTLLINIIKFFHWINFLFFSYDMAKEELIERMMIFMELDIDNPAHRERFDREVRNLDVIDDPEIMLGNIEVHKTRMERKTNKRYHAIIYDYLDYIPVENSKDDFSRNSIIAKTLRKISKRTKTIQIMLVQVPKEKGGNGNLPLDMTAPANSSNITNVAHIVLTFWRPYKGLAGKADNRMSVCVAKYRAGRGDYTIDLKFDGPKYKLTHIPKRRDAVIETDNGGVQEEVQSTGRGLPDLPVA